MAEAMQRKLNWRSALVQVLQSLREECVLKEAIVVVSGSYAHGQATARSDIDVLVLVEHTVRKTRAPYGVHLRFQNLSDFQERVRRGDDYAIDVLKFGRVLHDALNIWPQLKEQLKTARWPDWRVKLEYAERRIRLADELLTSGDVEAAREEYLLTATQIARAQLLRRRVHPMSRPQLGDQLRAIGQLDLAVQLEQLNEADGQIARLQRIGQSLERTLEEAHRDS